MATGSEVLLSRQQHSDLSSIAQFRSLPAGYVFRAKLILMLAEGASFNAIKRRLQTTASFVGSSVSGVMDWRDWTPIIPAKSPRRKGLQGTFLALMVV